MAVGGLGVERHVTEPAASQPTLYKTRGASLDIAKDQRNTYPGAVRVEHKNSVGATKGHTPPPPAGSTSTRR